MTTLIGGIAVLVMTLASLVGLLPRGGRKHRLVGTQWEQYVAVAICAGLALSFSMIVSGAITAYG